ncbi:hypothetical protein GCM10010182_38240 [Actinomadura cremea]|nr:hypothetical protein GCM10010182_38240 [Actinomadura cremea]
MWHLDRQASGRFRIRNHKGGLCLDAAGEMGAGGPVSRLTTFPCFAHEDHLWSFG